MQHRHILSLACACGVNLLPLSIQFANAQTADMSNSALEEIVVTSSRIETPLRQIGTSVSILNADEIAANGSASLIDVLRTLPSISVTNTGGAGQISNLRIRGEEGYRTLTLIDGIKISDPSVTQVQPQLEHLMSSGIERVEVLRGPQGLHYGADAGGVLNIRTRQSSQALRSNIDLSSGTFGTTQLSGNISAGNARADAFISGVKFKTDGFNARVTDNVLADKDGYDNTSMHARVGVNATENLRLELIHRDTAGDTAYDGCFNSADFSTVHDCDASFDQQASRVSAVLGTNYGSHSLAYSTTQTDREYFALGLSSFASTGALQRIEYIGELDSAESFSIVYGMDREEEENNGESRDQLGYYVEYLSDFSDQLYFTAGARRDDNDDFGEHTSYRVSAARLFELSVTQTIKLRGSYGTGFRAPSPYEASYNKGPFAFPPASTTTLQEETSKGYEVALEYFTNAGLHLEAVYFDQRIEDAIYFDSASYSGYLQDIGESLSEGVELSARLPLGEQLLLQANYTYNPTERPDGSQRQLRPRDLGNVQLAWHSADTRLRLSGFYRVAQNSKDAVGGQPVALEDTATADVTASFALRPSIELYGRIENLFDADFEEVLGYYSAGRAAYVGVRVNF
jgi:vitamin B12 transporter